MTDEQLRTVEEFANKYKLAPHDRPFASEAHDALAQLIKSGMNESEAKRLLRDAATAEDHPAVWELYEGWASIKPLYESRLVHFNPETRVAEKVDTLAISNLR